MTKPLLAWPSTLGNLNLDPLVASSPEAATRTHTDLGHYPSLDTGHPKEEYLTKGYCMRVSVLSILIGAAVSSCVSAQSVISAHSGVIHYVEGRVFVNDNVVELKFAQFPDLKENQELRTEEGRAEILLTPGSFLRIGENSAVRMLSNRLTDTRIEVLSGSALVESTELAKDNGITLLYKGNTMLLAKAGLYRVDSDPARFRAYEGEAIVRSESGQLTLKSSRETLLNGVLASNKFDNQVGDELYRWSSRRSSYVATANVSAARSAYTNNYGSGSYYPGYGGWAFNPWFGMFTFVPYSGMAYSPFGYSYWSPYTAYYYAPQYFYGGGGGGSSSSGAGVRPGSTGRGASGGASGRPVSGGGIGGGRGAAAGGGIAHGGLSSAGGGHSSGGGHR